MKTRCQKSGKRDIYPKGLVHGFEFFPSFYLIGIEKVFGDILDRKKPF